MLNAAFRCGSVRVVRWKKPGYSLLCAENDDGLSDGQRLKVMRLRAGLAIREVAKKVGICRYTLMNYESGRTKVKAEVFEKLECLYEQKAVCILLTLLYLGIKNIYLGPTLPAFVSKSVIDVLIAKYNITPTNKPAEDIKKILG